MRILCAYHENTRVFDQDTTQVLIGRYRSSQPVDLDLSPDQRVSRQHCRIWLEASQYWIEDLGSVHGTYVGAHDIRGKGKCPLAIGDKIRVGDTVLELDGPPVDATLQNILDDPGADAPVDITETVDAAQLAFSLEEQPKAEHGG